MPEPAKNRILAVDDNPAGRYATCRTLQHAGFQVLEATTGGEALRLVRTLPDLVLLDVHLPDIIGFEVCSKIKNDPETRTIPVVMHSATAITTESRIYGLNGGADAYLVQPIEAEELVATVAAMLRIREIEQDIERQASEAVRTETAARSAVETNLRQLSARLLEVRDLERRRIGRELHDSLGQTLAALKMTFHQLERQVKAADGSGKLLDDARALIEQAIVEIRTTSHLLHPPLLEQEGFESAARLYVEGFKKRSGIEVELEMTNCDGISNEIQFVLFRILQEGLTNVMRHSESYRAKVVLEHSGDTVSLSIRDFGKGIPYERLEEIQTSRGSIGVGLAGIRERAAQFKGQLQITSDGNGTTVKVELPKSSDQQFSAQAGQS